jgi:hypothetical protein
VGIHLPRPTASAFSKENQGQAVFVSDPQHAIHLLVTEMTLSSGQNRIVVGHYHTPGFVGFKKRSVNRTDARDKAVGRSLADEIMHRPPLALSGDRKRSVFNEMIVTEVFYVGASRALVLLLPPCHCFRALLIKAKGMPLYNLG